ncbi:NAD(P)/FAD-dependent oxidoreductase [Leptolyngbya sp. FACHB-261]|uniref:NAD(P)/FAD-dependent oxidoreductase n=1 Tax=Leptolyngbya sp. FACHB-261 TaxID=2692806 RepID=UPI001F554A9C|nr:flavin-dependent dehydrogenase [Leptolyngbya sp. FACHB-261]
MYERLYLEVPTPDLEAVRAWLQREFQPVLAATVSQEQPARTVTPDGIRLALAGGELSIFVWSVQRTTYLKAFRWAQQMLPGEPQLLRELEQQVRRRFPCVYPEPPAFNPDSQSIFEALEQKYPLTVKYFQRFPDGEYDLMRAYWWEQRWRQSVRSPQKPREVVIQGLPPNIEPATSRYDLIYLGGALGVIHAAVMARLGYRVLLLERLPFGRMNREWNISRSEAQSLIEIGLLSEAEFEGLIAREYVDGFNKFFDANNPPQARAPVLHTPTVLNIALDSEKLLRLCGQKLRDLGGEIRDQTEFEQVYSHATGAVVAARHLPTGELAYYQGRLVVDAMGTASPIAWQLNWELNGGKAFDSVCPTVGAVIADGFEPGVWDSRYGDVLYSHGDISRGRQLIWELFPGEGKDLTFYLFHYHQVHPDNPGSLLEMYEDFFAILPEYRRCDLDQLVWKKATFGYIPGHFSTGATSRRVGFDRLIAVGDAAALQSPLVFTGFGSLVRNLPRLTELLDTALKYDLLASGELDRIRAYQSNVAVTWLFSKGMMVPTGKHLPPARVNSMLNTFFGILAGESPEIADAFIKDRAGWLAFNRMAIRAAFTNPALLPWIWELAGPRDALRWLVSYLSFTWNALLNVLLAGWVPPFLRWMQRWIEPQNPLLWFRLLAWSYWLTYGAGQPGSGFSVNRSKLPEVYRQGSLPTVAKADTP